MRVVNPKNTTFETKWEETHTALLIYQFIKLASFINFIDIYGIEWYWFFSNFFKPMKLNRFIDTVAAMTVLFN
jgi:hypothetical protein